jgi:hypothetical protein
MRACVLKTTKEFKELLSKVQPRQHPVILAAKIGVWQEINDTDEFPIADEVQLGREIVKSDRINPPIPRDLDGQLNMFSLNTGQSETILDPQYEDVLRQRIDQLLAKMGFKIESTMVFTDINGAPVNAKALTDFLNQIIQVSEGITDISDLTEEAMHVFVRMLKVSDDPIYNEMLDVIEGMDEYVEVINDYSDVSGYTKAKLHEEAIVKAVRNVLINRKHELADPKNDVYRSLWTKIKDWFKSLGTKVKDNPFIKTARMFMNDEYDSYVDKAQSLGADKMLKKTVKPRSFTEDKLKQDQERFTKVILDVNDPTLTDNIYRGFGDTIERYYDTLRKVVVGKRITDAAERKHNIGKNKADSRENSQRPNVVAARNVGTKMHSVIEGLIKALTTNDKEALRKLKVEHKLSSEVWKVLIRDVNHYIAELEEIQKRIDPKGKISWYTEQRVFDESGDIAGTIDLLAIYSDNTNSICEFKFKQTNKYNSGINNATGKRVLSSDVVSYDIEEEYDIQVSLQKNILARNYGGGETRTSRLVPYAISLAFNAKTGEITENITEIFSPLDGNEYLTTLSLGRESLGIAEMDRHLTKAYDLLSRMKSDRKKKGISDYNKERLGIEIRQLGQAIQALQKNFDMSLITGSAYNLAFTVLNESEDGKSISENEQYIDGELNPRWMDMDELAEAKNALEVYAELLNQSYPYSSSLKQDSRKLDKETISNMDENIKDASYKVNSALTAIKSKIQERITSEAESRFGIDMHRPVRELTALQRMFNTLSEIDHPVFEYASRLIRLATAEKNRKVVAITNQITELQDPLFKYADSIGVSRLQIFDKLIESEGFHLKSMYAKELFSTLIPKNRELGNAAWFKERYNIKQEYMDSYQERFAARKIAINERYKDRILSKTEKINKSKIRKDLLAQWVADNDYTLDSFWLNKKNQYKLELKEEYKDVYLSEDYKAISAVPALKNFYDFLVQKNQEFSEILGQDTYISNTFIPKVRKTLIDDLVQGNKTFAEIWRSFLDSLRIKQDGVMGQYDIDSGELQYKVPLLFVNPYKDKHGNIDTTVNSRDLGRNLMLFAESVYNFQEKTKIEPTILALADWLQMNVNGEMKLNNTNAPERDVKGFVKRNFLPSDNLDTFKRLMNYYLYGQRLQGDKAILGGKFSQNSILSTIMDYHRMKTLGLAIIPPLAARVAGEGGIFFEGVKDRFYNTSHVTEAHKMFASNSETMNMLVKFMNIYQEEQSFRLANNLSASKIAKGLTLDNMYRGYSFTDEKIDNIVLVSMALSHGFDQFGNVVRLTDEDIANGKKNLVDSIVVVDDKMTITGMTNESYDQFRSMARNVTGSIKGQMTSEDINAVNTYLVGRMFMMYRNWMPKVIKERLGSFRYNPVLEGFEQGRYNIVINNVFNETATFLTVLENIGSTMMRIVGLMDNFNKYKTGDPNTKAGQLARLHVENEYKKFQEQFKGDSRFEDDFSIDDFIELRAGQSRAFIAEARVMVIFLSLLMALGKLDLDDDDIADYKEIWIGRKLYQILNRSQSEWSFIWNPLEWKNFIQNPMAISGFLTDFLNVVRNTKDEVLIATGVKERAPQDKSPLFYYSTKLAPAGRSVSSFFEFFEQDKKKSR